MAQITFTGPFKDQLSEFIQLKRQCGFKYGTEEKILLIFDKMTVTIGFEGNAITKKLADEWSKKRANEGAAYRYKRCVTLNQFANFLGESDRPCAMSHAPKPKKTFVPHIYTDDEISRILNVIDNWDCMPIKTDSVRFILPALIRTLVSTGIRVGEALNLQDKDVDTTNNILVLRDTKNGKERLLPFSESVSSVLSSYRKVRLQICQKSKEPNFFLSARGHKVKPEAVYKTFRMALSYAGIPFKGGHYGPRVHDFRHTFAVKALAHMAESGLDIYCSLPILSTYLGHQSIEATNEYVRLASEIYPSLISKVDEIFLNIYPSLDNETD